ncbi:MAG: hypothetical protein KBG30_04945 [Bacteroidales bacterium]|nr:hypothetical protein [Bacteroidales bacterium]
MQGRNDLEIPVGSFWKAKDGILLWLVVNRKRSACKMLGFDKKGEPVITGTWFDIRDELFEPENRVKIKWEEVLKNDL